MDVATVTAITTIRTAVGYKLLTATANGPISPTSTAYSYLNFIYHI